MKKIWIGVFALIFIGSLVFCYLQKTKPIPKTSIYAPDAFECYYENNSKKPRQFPFNEADKIEIISFNNIFGGVVIIEKEEFVMMKDKMVYRKTGNDKLSNRKIQEKILLGDLEIKSLMAVLYDYNSKSGESESAACYEPHHAVLFYKAGKALAFLEVCFKCKNIRSSNDISFGNFCDEKFVMLESFMNVVGIKYGINKY